jgi:hypothetical protein
MDNKILYKALIFKFFKNVVPVLGFGTPYKAL